MTGNKIREIIRPTGRIIFLFLLLTPGNVFSQRYYFDNYSVSQGLAQSTVYNILQDREDNYWMGTQAGLSKFDGVVFVNYTAEDGISEGGVRALFEDSYGNIWTGHDGGGVTRYDGDRFEIFDQAELHLKSNITTILEDADRHLWITSQESGAAMIINPGAPLDSIRYEMYLGRRLSDRIFGSFLSDDGSLYFVTDPVVETLHHTSEEGDVYDGMDLSLITFDKKSMEIKYAGAYNSMYLVGKGKLQEVKADRQPIGLGGAKNKEFKTVVVDVQKGDMVYLFSDGYADQFGGAKLKKFKSANMKELLVNISGEKVDRQREILDESIEKWRGNIEQIDNILVIGRRF